jgi:hypothetical protein
MNILDNFGKVVAEDLRDSALNHYLDLETGFIGSKSARELSASLSEFSEEQRQLIRKIITECVDTGVHDFLFALEENRHGVSVSINGQDISGISDGLQGEIFTEDGWFEKFSQHKENGI